MQVSRYFKSRVSAKKGESGREEKEAISLGLRADEIISQVQLVIILALCGDALDCVDAKCLALRYGKAEPSIQ